MGNISREDRMFGGLWGAVVGDALGVPVEFKGRDVRKKDPVTGMLGYGTFGLPPGSWSDDSSLMLCTAESLLDGFDTGRMGDLFVRWFTTGLWTPHGQAFDVGHGTRQAISAIESGIPAEQAGGTQEGNNGNGSLMRILPVALYCEGMAEEDILLHAHRASSITHGHPRAMMACGIYCLMTGALLRGLSPSDAYLNTMDNVKNLYRRRPFSKELSHFDRLLAGNIGALPEDAIESDGYVLHTLEAAVWCLVTTGSYREAVLAAVNLGLDTDTTAIVTGGLAGICYGIKAIPREWRDQIVRKEDIDILFDKVVKKIPVK